MQPRAGAAVPAPPQACSFARFASFRPGRVEAARRDAMSMPSITAVEIYTCWTLALVHQRRRAVAPGGIQCRRPTVIVVVLMPFRAQRKVPACLCADQQNSPDLACTPELSVLIVAEQQWAEAVTRESGRRQGFVWRLRCGAGAEYACEGAGGRRSKCRNVASCCWMRNTASRFWPTSIVNDATAW